MPESLPVPFYTGAGTARSGAPRLLLLSYFFPPSQAVGALRWQKFAGHFAEAGVGLDVITLDPASLSKPDPARLAELPAGTRVYGVPQPLLRTEQLERWLLSLRRPRTSAASPAPQAAAPATPRPRSAPAPRADSYSREEILGGQVPGSRLARAWHAWQDLARIEAWADAASELGMRVLDPGVHRAIISCGPPHPVHEGARRLAGRVRLPYIVDLRDPWALVERLPAHIASPYWFRRSAADERRVVSDASLIVLNTESAQAAMQQSHPDRAEAIRCVMNGCDEEVAVGGARTGKFLVAYAGSVYLDRDPRPLFQAARAVVEELKLTPAQFAIEFMGNARSYGGLTLGAIAGQEGIGDYVRVHAARPRAEALAFLAGASMLLSLPQDSEMAIPSKIFEYFQYDAFLLALAEPESATERLLRGTTADTVSSRDIQGITRVLRARYLDWQRGAVPKALAREERFTRRHQAGQLLRAIAPLIGLTTGTEASCAR